MSGPIHYPGPLPEIQSRHVLGRPIALHHEHSVAEAVYSRGAPSGYTLQLGANLLFDVDGILLLLRTVTGYRGRASHLDFALRVPPPVWRDYYSLKEYSHAGAGEISLPVTAVRHGPGEDRRETLTVDLGGPETEIPFPESMGGPQRVGIPGGLLFPYEIPHDLLFANQIALLGLLRRSARWSPRAWLAACFSPGHGLSFAQRVVLGFRRIAPGAAVHPTAVVEGSIIGPGARVGAHAVVRYSLIGADARIHDGAKVELSVVGSRTWLMQDLVLYRSAAENDVFLIHGPYQFSYFQHRSAAFATILMDCRPDGLPIKVKTAGESRAYGGRFLGSVLEEGSQTLGGCMVAPGRVVPAGRRLAPDPGLVHTLREPGPLGICHPSTPEARA